MLERAALEFDHVRERLQQRVTRHASYPGHSMRHEKGQTVLPSSLRARTKNEWKRVHVYVRAYPTPPLLLLLRQYPHANGEENIIQ